MSILDTHERYRNPQPIGSGGMGTVFKVRDQHLGRSVAAKVLNAVLITKTDIERFEREASSMAQLAHPHICRIYDFDWVEHHPFLVMELISGRSLQTVLDQDWPLPNRQVAHWIWQVAMALQHAHDVGIYHRDLKPQNLMIDDKGNAIVMDFGLAKDLYATVSLTQSGGFMGTPAYAPPEQIRDTSSVDHRADIYSLGVVLYQLLCRNLPFSGNLLKIYQQQLKTKTPAPPSSKAPSVDTKLEAICLKATALDSDERYQNAEDLGRDLQSYLEQTSAAPKISESKPPLAPNLVLPKPAVGVVPFDAKTAREHQEDWAAYLGYSWAWENSIGMKMVMIPPGALLSRSPHTEEQGEVTLPQPFAIGQFVVTQSQWQKVMATSPWQAGQYVKVGPSCPATEISWNDGIAFCEKLTRLEHEASRLPRDWEYTLPSEVQWEFACRAGTTTQFCFGDDEEMLGDFGWFDENTKNVGERYAHPVGQKQPNAFGVHDMHGNVWEWCLSRSDSHAGSSQAGNTLQAVRGGSWLDKGAQCRCANSALEMPDVRDYVHGCRVVAVQSESSHLSGMPTHDLLL